MLTKKQLIDFIKGSRDDAEVLIDGKPVIQVYQDGKIRINSERQTY